MITYKVGNPDPFGGLWQIALHFKISFDAIKQANPQLARQNWNVYPGQLLNIPVPDTITPTGPTYGDSFLKDTAEINVDPTTRQNYIQNVVKSIAIPIWGGNFWLYKSPMPRIGIDSNSIQMPRNEPRLSDDPIKEGIVFQNIYKNRVAADSALNALNEHRHRAYTYYIGQDSYIYPTIISDTSAPLLCDALRKMLVLEREEAQAAANLGVELFFWHMGARNPSPIATRTPATAAEITAEAWRRQAKFLVNELRSAGKPVKVNLAGAGEVVDAINVNKCTNQQVKNIPNLIRRSANNVSDIFESGAADEIISNDVVQGMINWRQAAEGSFKILKSGGKISIAPFAGNIEAHLAEIYNALQSAGFKNVEIVARRYVKAIKP